MSSLTILLFCMRRTRSGEWLLTHFMDIEWSRPCQVTVDTRVLKMLAAVVMRSDRECICATWNNQLSPVRHWGWFEPYGVGRDTASWFRVCSGDSYGGEDRVCSWMALTVSMFQTRIVGLEGHVFKIQSLEVVGILLLRHTLASWPKVEQAGWRQRSISV